MKKLILSLGDYLEDYVVAGASAEAAGKIALASKEVREGLTKLDLTVELEYIALANTVEYLGDQTPDSVIALLIQKILESKEQTRLVTAAVLALVSIGQRSIKPLEDAKQKAAEPHPKELLEQIIERITSPPSPEKGLSKPDLLSWKLFAGSVTQRYEAISETESLTEEEAKSHANLLLMKFERHLLPTNIGFSAFRSLLIVGKKYPDSIQPLLIDRIAKAGAAPSCAVLLAELRDIPFLVQTLKRKDEAFSNSNDMIVGTATALGYVGEEAVDPLIVMLNSDAGGLRYRAVLALKVMGPRAIKALPDMINALDPAKYKDPYLTTKVLEAVRWLYPVATKDQKTQIIATLESLKTSGFAEITDKATEVLKNLTKP